MWRMLHRDGHPYQPLFGTVEVVFLYVWRDIGPLMLFQYHILYHHSLAADLCPPVFDSQ